MADFVQLPGQLNIRATRGDELNIVVNLQRDVTSHTFESYVYNATAIAGQGGVGSLNGVGTTVTAPTIGITDAGTGSMVIGLSEAQTILLNPGESYRWYLRWVAPGELTRTILSGSVVMEAP